MKQIEEIRYPSDDLSASNRLSIPFVTFSQKFSNSLLILFSTL